MTTAISMAGMPLAGRSRMTSLNQLLVATDLSPPSLRAIDRAFGLARESGARLAVMHALALDTLEELRQLLGERLSVVMQKIEEDVQGTLTRIAADPSRAAGVDATIRVERGLPLPTIVACARDIAADLVLVGAQGEDILQRLILGSTASGLLRRSPCPVLVVKQPTRASYGRILIPVDFSPASGIAVETARLIAPNAHVTLLYVFDVPFEGKMHFAGVSEDIIYRYRFEAGARAAQRLAELAAATGLAADQYRASVLYGAPALQILAEEEQHGHDLIVMGKHGTHVTEEFLLGSVTKRILAQSQCDVLVVVDKRPPIDAVSFAYPSCEKARA